MPAVNPGDNYVDPKIRRRHPELDAQQLRFIGHGEGPLLGLAGPGAGKTRCIELRASNLLLLGRVRPEELTLCTFGKPAARELGERFLASAQALGCGGTRPGFGLRRSTACAIRSWFPMPTPLAWTHRTGSWTRMTNSG